MSNPTSQTPTLSTATPGRRNKPLRALDLVPIQAVRERLAALEGEERSVAGRLWRSIRDGAYRQPMDYPWYVPFVAAVEDDPGLHAHAKRIIQDYLDAAAWGGLGNGVQNHFWCYAFPHARWALWFDLVRSASCWSGAEAEEAAAAFVTIQARDFHSGMLTKPFPEIADNQAGSLCLSSVIVGSLFREWPGRGELAAMLADEAIERAPTFIGALPSSGYTGEGTTYQARVVAPMMVHLVEALTHLTGQDHFEEKAPPNGTSAADVLRMDADLLMPSGLGLPWDAYGYQTIATSPIAYLARRTGDPYYAQMLEHLPFWSEEYQVGWGFDDWVWTLIHWPDWQDSHAQPIAWRNWQRSEVGAAIASPDGSRYLMQMWDPTENYCARCHVNPNALIVEAFGSPLTVDGTPVERNSNPFIYEDAWHEQGYGGLSRQSSNFGYGCGGAHGVIQIDGRDSFRPPAAGYELSHPVPHDSDTPQIVGDVTGLYQSVWPDVERIRRRSRLIENAGFLVEDLVQASEPHEIASRWFFRPGVEVDGENILLKTQEGVELQVIKLLGDGRPELSVLDGFPTTLERRCARVDWAADATREARWLWLWWPCETRREVDSLTGGWRAWAGDARDDGNAQPQGARDAAPDAPITEQPFEDGREGCWYQRELAPPTDRAWHIRLPRSTSADARVLFVAAGRVVAGDRPDCTPTVPVDVPCPEALRGAARVTVRIFLPRPDAHYPKASGKASENRLRQARPIVLMAEHTPERVAKASYRDGLVSIETSAGRRLSVEHRLMDRVGESE